MVSSLLNYPALKYLEELITSNEKKVKATEEETKKELQTEEQDAKLTDEELAQVSGGWFWNKENNSKTYWCEKI